MASSLHPVQDIEQILTCSICLDIFKSPKTLPCGHSYCEECLVENVKVILQNGQEGILCPQCRAFSKRGEFIKIYALGDFLEYHSLLKKSDGHSCHLCDETDQSEAVSRCVDCKIDLCEGCKKKHKKTPNCRAHTYKACGGQPPLDLNCYCDLHPDYVTNLYCVDCEKVICLHCKVTDHERHKSETVDVGIQRLRSVVEKKVKRVLKDIAVLNYEDQCMEREIPAVKGLIQKVKVKYKESKEAMIAAIEQQFKGISVDLDRCEKDVVDKIEEARRKNKLERAVRQNIVDICQTTLSNAQGCSLLKGLTEGLMEQISEQERKPVILAERCVKLPVFEQNPDIRETCQFLKKPSYVEESQVFVPRNVRSMGVNIEKVLSEVGECIQTVDLQGGDPCRISVVNGNLWLPGTGQGEYKVYSIRSKTFTQKSCPVLQCISSFCQTSKREVIAASNDGLYSLSTQGLVHYKVCDGCFSDVCTDGDKLVAVERRTCEVQVFGVYGERWNKQAGFVLKDIDKHIKTLHLVHDTVYVGYNWTHKVYRYSLEGECLEVYGTGQGVWVGDFCRPFVSGTDFEDTLVVCDAGNDRVQVRDQQGVWKAFKLQGVELPRDVLVVGGRLYVLWGKLGLCKLSTYGIS